MVKTLGVDHGTQRLRFCLLDGDFKSYLEIDRQKASSKSVLNNLEEKGFLDVDLIGLTYSMADGINKITPIARTNARGQKKTVTGTFVGGGTQLFDEILTSKKRAVLIPGLHRNIQCLDERFKLLYSHMAASEKVALSYHVFNAINKKKKIKNLLISDVSSNTVTIAIKDSQFFGALDACIGAHGLIHGPLDLECIRKIDNSIIQANRSFYESGVLPRSGLSQKFDSLIPSKERKLALDSLMLSVKMEVAGLASIIDPDAIALSGSAVSEESIKKSLITSFEEISPVYCFEKYSASLGAAEIARDILSGKKNFLGISTSPMY